MLASRSRRVVLCERASSVSPPQSLPRPHVANVPHNPTQIRKFYMRSSSLSKTLPRRPKSSETSTSSPPRRSVLGKKMVPRGFWLKRENQRAFMLQLGRDLGIPLTEQAAWYKLSTAEIRRRGGFGLLRMHDGSVSKILQALFPEFIWDPSRFVRKPRNFWSSIEKKRDYVGKILGPKLGILDGEFEKWYQVSNEAIIRAGGSTLLAMNSYSLLALVSSIFPEYPWDPSKFGKRSQGHWTTLENQRKGLQEIGTRLSIAPDDYEAWYKVSVEDFAKSNAWGLLSSYGGSPSLLITTVFSEHQWDPWKFAHNKSRTALSRAEL